MAAKRMFSIEIISSSDFITLPHSAQCLYFHLAMHADDDGYCEYVGVMRLILGNEDDLNLLSENDFIYMFDSRVLMIVSWKEHNAIPKDRYKESRLKEKYPYDKNTKKNMILKHGDNINATECLQNVTADKIRVGKNRLDKKKKSKKEKDALASQAISLFNEIADKKKDVNNVSHIGRCNVIIKQLKSQGVKSDADILAKFRFVFDNKKKERDDSPQDSFARKNYDLDTLTRKVNFFNYVDKEPYVNERERIKTESLGGSW